MFVTTLIAGGAFAAGAAIAYGVMRERCRRSRAASRVVDRLSIALGTVRGDAPPPSEETVDSLLAIIHRQRRLSTVLKAMPEGLALLDGARRVLYCNDGFSSMFRIGEDESFATGRITARDVPALEHAFQEAAGKRRVTTTELRLLTTPPRDILVTLTPYSDEELADGAILTAIDITSQKRVEAMRSEFVANVSHELRTPLAAIRGYVETCLEPVPEGGTLPYKQFLGVIHQHTLRLNALIEDLLTLSRIESRGMQFTFRQLQVYDAVDNAMGTLQSEANRKRVVLVNALPPLLPNVKADESALERIIVNLMENAIKYSEEDSEVRITARTQADKVCIMIEDNGVGIPKEDQTRIFERFYRVDKARSRKAGGTGLGLSIVKHLVQAHGGEVWVDSQPGKGSTFFFTLTMAHATEDVQKLAPV